MCCGACRAHTKRRRVQGVSPIRSADVDGARGEPIPAIWEEARLSPTQIAIRLEPVSRPAGSGATLGRRFGDRATASEYSGARAREMRKLWPRRRLSAPLATG